MVQLRLAKVSIAFGVHPLLHEADFQLDKGERVGLIGRNGEGKSTFLKILAGSQPPDSGEVWRQPGLRLAFLEQTPDLLPTGLSEIDGSPAEVTIYDAVAGALGEIGVQLAHYHHLLATDLSSDSAMKALGRVQQWLDAHDGWSLQQRVESVLSRLDLPADKSVATLSGGWQRRVDLARALVLNPDVLLLDEPTNHLDLEAIAWLEDQLLAFPGAVVFITHDRAFLQKLATRIIDLDRGTLTSWPGDYADYLVRKAAALEEEATHNALFDKKLAEEESWIRQGIKARRTRNEGRVRALKKLRNERAQRRERQGTAKILLERGEESGRKVIEAVDVSIALGGKPIVDHFSTTILRGDRVGLIGPNGAGKTTLLKLLLQQLPPDSGSVEHGTRLSIAYFDQLRDQLDPEHTVCEVVGDGRDWVAVGNRQVHVMSYLADFLFSPARARSPIRSLSGGEKNRVLLARLFSRPANVLVMDEPTNDLDLESLELLEDLLAGYDGTLLLVSHDRAFLDGVVTQSLVFEGDGRVSEYVGGYSDWQSQRKSTQPSKPAKPAVPVAATEPPYKPAAPARRKLSFKEQRELEQLPARIESLEARQAELSGLIHSGALFRQDRASQETALAEFAALEQELAMAYQRWETLDSV
ncbi:MAG: ATP-binding cassette domain-containing protein [Methylococcaceae bacterium]|nr:MAG: ATP-binding cassette domain-containing protein [Methylococcaceae bacterium]